MSAVLHAPSPLVRRGSGAPSSPLPMVSDTTRPSTGRTGSGHRTASTTTNTNTAAHRDRLADEHGRHTVLDVSQSSLLSSSSSSSSAGTSTPARTPPLSSAMTAAAGASRTSSTNSSSSSSAATVSSSNRDVVYSAPLQERAMGLSASTAATVARAEYYHTPPPPPPSSSSRLLPRGDGGASPPPIPVPVLVEQQRDRIRAVVHERDATAAELRELHMLFRRLHEDYEAATRELEAQRLQLHTLRAQHSTQGDELRQWQASHARQQQRIADFEAEWGSSAKHLREHLDALVQERDAMQTQRDACMTDNSDLRRQLIQMQGEMHTIESQHREALRVQADAHARELRAALQEKEEQLQARTAATRREARLVQQELDQLGSGQASAREDRESMRWRLSELEAVVSKKEQLRAELERVVVALRSRLAEQEEAARQEAQRSTQRVQDLERLYRGQAAQEQQRAQVLHDDLAAARRATQDALRQQEVLQQSHSDQSRDAAARAARLEDELRQQLRAVRAELEEAQARALQHEAAARRGQREAETLQASRATEQEERERLLLSQAAQAQQLSRVEGRAHALQIRLTESEREAELLRCAIERATWTREAQEAAHHTAASLHGVPRAAITEHRRRRRGLPSGHTEEEGEEAAAEDGEDSRRWPPPTRATVEPATQIAWAAEGPDSRPAAPGMVRSDDALAAAEALPATGSPRRPASQSSSSRAARHVESIERTARRGAGGGDTGGRADRDPLGAPPPLHPGTPRVAAEHGGVGVAALSASSPLRAVSRTPARRSSSEAAAGHMYHVTPEAGEDTGLAAAYTRALARRPRVSTAQSTLPADDVYFDGVGVPTPSTRGTPAAAATVSRYAVPSLGGASTRRVQGYASSAYAPSHRDAGAAHTWRALQRGSPHVDEAADGLAAARGRRAAQYIARTSRSSSAASHADAEAPAIAAAAAAGASAATAGAHDRGDAALQRYLRDTVMRVLADHGAEEAPSRPLPNDGAGTQHNARLTQRSGSGSGCGASGRAAPGLEVVEEEDDFGSASRPRSLVGGRRPGRRTPQYSDALSRIAGGSSAAYSLSSHEAGVAPPTRLPAAAHLSSADGGVAHTLDVLAHRQQQLLQSLRQPLDAHRGGHGGVGAPGIAAPAPLSADVALGTTVLDRYGGASVAPAASQALHEPRLQPPPQQRYPTEHESSNVDETHASRGFSPGVGASLTGRALLQLPRHNAAAVHGGAEASSDAAVAAEAARASAVGAADMDLDPRQLSYSTTTGTVHGADALLGRHAPATAAAAAHPGAVSVNSTHVDTRHRPSAERAARPVAETVSTRSAPSVSPSVSSLSQLERRLAIPF